MQDVLQIEDKVLAPAELFIHAKLVLLHQLPPVEFIPDDAVIIIRRALRHASRELFPAQYALFVNRTLSRGPAVHNAVKIGNHQVRVIFLGRMYKEGGRLGRNPVVRIEKLEVLSGREIQCLVPRVGYSAVWLMHHTDARVLRSVGIAERRRAVFGAVIHHEQLKIRKGLREYTVKATRQHLFRIVYRNDNRNLGH